MDHPRVIYAASYYRRDALIDCVDRVLPTVNWTFLHSFDKRMGMNWDTVPPVLFALGGYKIIPWSASCEIERRYKQYTNRTCDDAPLRHKGEVPTAMLYDLPYNNNLEEGETENNSTMDSL
jgi:hypothetical protein